MSAAQILVVGSINQDAVARVDHFPAPGETLIALDAFTGLGGKGANQAVAAARAGAKVIMAGAVGTDAVGTELADQIATFGVDVSQVRKLSGLTGVAYIYIDNSGENTIVVFSGANHKYEFSAEGKPSIVLMQGELKPAVVSAAAAFAMSLDARFVLNLAPFMQLDEDILSAANPLIVNELEAAMLLEQLDIEAGVDDVQLSRQIAKRLSTNVVVTLGSAGASFSDGSDVWLQPAARPEKIVDTTGAGDAFVGALAAALVEGKSISEGVKLGAAAGSLAIENLGTTGAYPTREKLEARFIQTKDAAKC